jgi:hypothetical protein
MTSSNGVTGSLAFAASRFRRGSPQINRNTTILSPATPQQRQPSPRSVSLTAPAVTTQHVAQHLAVNGPVAWPANGAFAEAPIGRWV